jgi:hypothetical protein
MKQQQAIQYLAFDVHQATIVANCRDAEREGRHAGHRGHGGQGDPTVDQELRAACPRGVRRGYPSRISGRTLALMTSFGRGAATSG